jgi:hypothetical protein
MAFLATGEDAYKGPAAAAARYGTCKPEDVSSVNNGLPRETRRFEVDEHP